MRQFAIGIVAAAALVLSIGTPAAEASFQCGDVNADGSIDSVDALLVLQIDAGLIGPEDVLGKVEAGRVLTAGDVNSDGSLNSLDGLLILQHVAGLIPTLDGCGLEM